MSVHPAALTRAQQGTVGHIQGLNVPASWFVGEPGRGGPVEVIALGRHFAWSFLIEPDGSYSSSEAQVGDFSTGIEV